VLVQTIFAPVLISGVLYYLFRPFVHWMSKKMPRILAILIIYLGMGSLFTLLVMLIGPELQTQFKSLSKNIPTLINEFNQWFIQIQHTEIVSRFLEGTNISLEELFNRFGEYATGVASMVGTSISNVIGIVTNIVLVVVIIPFIL